MCRGKVDERKAAEWLTQLGGNVLLLQSEASYNIIITL